MIIWGPSKIRFDYLGPGLRKLLDIGTPVPKVKEFPWGKTLQRSQKPIQLTKPMNNFWGVNHMFT